MSVGEREEATLKIDVASEGQEVAIPLPHLVCQENRIVDRDESKKHRNKEERRRIRIYF
jgi:hypothetical protein